MKKSRTLAICLCLLPLLLLTPLRPLSAGANELRCRVIGPGGKPVAGAEVQLIAIDAFVTRKQERTQLLKTTDAKGMAYFSDLAAGRWGVMVHHPDFVPWLQRELLVEAGKDNRLTVKLDEGYTLTGKLTQQVNGVHDPVLDANIILEGATPYHKYEIALTDENGEFAIHHAPYGQRLRLHAIKGERSEMALESPHYIEVVRGQKPKPVELQFPNTTSVRGIVATFQGQPIKGAMVTTIWQGSGRRGISRRGLNKQEWRYTLTNVKGEYQLHGLLPGDKYWLSAGAIGYGGHRKGGIVAGNPRLVEFNLQQTCQLSGRVLDAKTRQPVAGVQLGKPSSLIDKSFQMPEPAIAPLLVTDQQGRFHVVNVLPSRRHLKGGIVAPDGKTTHLAMPYKLGDLYPGEHRRNIELLLYECASVEGVVIDESTGKQTAANLLWAMHENVDDPDRTMDGSVAAYPDRPFKIEGLLPGVMKLRIDWDTDAVLEIGAGQQLKDLILRIPKSRPRHEYTGPKVELSGIVIDSRGNPAPGVSVTPTGDEGVTWHYGNTWSEHLGESTDENGHFLISLPGTPKLWAITSVLQTTSEPFTPTKEKLKTSVTLRLPPSGSIAGCITDTKGVPVDEAMVRVAQGVTAIDPPYSIYHYTAKTALDGTFFMPKIQTGKHPLTVEKDGYTLLSVKNVEVNEAVTTNVRYALKSATTPKPEEPKPFTISGKIVCLDGKPHIRGWRVSCDPTEITVIP